MEALSDGHTVAPLIKVGYLHSRRGAKTYLFHFGYQTKESEYPQRLGSVRGEDLPYIFGLPLVNGQPHFAQNYSRQDMGVAEAVLNFVTNFCKTGDPNEAGHQQVSELRTRQHSVVLRLHALVVANRQCCIRTTERRGSERATVASRGNRTRRPPSSTSVYVSESFRGWRSGVMGVNQVVLVGRGWPLIMLLENSSNHTSVVHIGTHQ